MPVKNSPSTGIFISNDAMVVGREGERERGRVTGENYNLCKSQP